MRRKRTTALKLRDEGHNGHGGSVHIRGDLLDKFFGGGTSPDRAFGLQMIIVLKILPNQHRSLVFEDILKPVLLLLELLGLVYVAQVR